MLFTHLLKTSKLLSTSNLGLCMAHESHSMADIKISNPNLAAIGARTLPPTHKYSSSSDTDALASPKCINMREDAGRIIKCCGEACASISWPNDMDDPQDLSSLLSNAQDFITVSRSDGTVEEIIFRGAGDEVFLGRIYDYGFQSSRNTMASKTPETRRIVAETPATSVHTAKRTAAPGDAIIPHCAIHCCNKECSRSSSVAHFLVPHTSSTDIRARTTMEGFTGSVVVPTTISSIVFVGD